MGSMKSVRLIHAITVLMCLGIAWCDSDAVRPSNCNTQSCWSQFQEVQEYYQSEVPGMSDHAVRQCVTLRTYKACLQDLYRQFASLCVADMGYQGSRNVIEMRMLTLNCSDLGPVYPHGPAPANMAPRPRPCSFRGLPTYRFCSLFGDPHLHTFGNEFQTCKLEGAWPLVDNGFLTVQVSNEPVYEGAVGTVTTKVTVIVHPIGEHQGSCGVDEALFYRTEGTSLASTFEDGLSDHGQYASVTVRAIIPDERVEIRLHYIDTRVIVQRIVGEYLSVSVVMPDDVVNATSRRGGSGTFSSTKNDIAMQQLCRDGCPRKEKVGLGSRTVDGTALVVGRGGISLRRAVVRCKEVGLRDYYLDACVFDLLNTADTNFTSVARAAQELAAHFGARVSTRGRNGTAMMSLYEEQVAARSATGGSHYRPLVIVLMVAVTLLWIS